MLKPKLAHTLEGKILETGTLAWRVLTIVSPPLVLIVLKITLLEF
jgi:hypothetical protein